MSELAKIFENAVQNATKPEDIRIICDCDGTLFKNGEFNTPLFLWLYERLMEGYEVILFSAVPKESMLRLFSSYHTGHPETFINNDRIVTLKRELAGTKALLVIDDDHKSHQVDAKHRWNPNDPGVMAHINQSLKRPIRPMPPGML